VRQRRQPGGGRKRVPGERARLVHGSQRRHHGHDVAPAGVGGDRQPAADDLAEAREVGADTEGCLCATGSEAEAGDDLVEHEERTGAVALRP
jgi:hypothetical protein